MNISSLLFSAVLLVSSQFTSDPIPFHEDGLIAYYSFDQCNAVDLTDNGSNGDVFGNPGCHCGVDGNALYLDGLDDFIEFPGIVNRCFNTIDFTVSFYIKPNKYSVFAQSLLSKRTLCDENNMFDLQLDVPKRIIKTDLYEIPEKYFKDISPGTPDTDWIHYAIVRKGIYAYTYINGQLQREGRRCSGVDIGNEAILSFSNSVCLSSGRMVRFKGGLDELRVYDRALSDQEIADLYGLHPVELAEIDCISFVPEKGSEEIETAYFCGY